MNEDEQTKMAAFAAELAELSRKYDIWIYGCGCCGSPFTGSLADDELPEYTFEVDRDGDAANLGPKEKNRNQ